MSIPSNSQCILCTLTRNIRNLQDMGCSEQTVTDFTCQLMRCLADLPQGAPALCTGPDIAKLYTRYCGCPEDRFAQEKEMSNRFVLDRLDNIRSRVEKAEDPVYAGLQYAILGNYIDFSALQGEVSMESLDAMLDKAGDFHPDAAAYDRLLRDLQKGKRLLYLTDNAGEIGFDRIFAEQIQKAYPHLSVTFCVKGGPANNDATREDAEAMGIPFPVIDTGNRFPGVWEPGCDARRALESSDVILSKGQANVETLWGCGKNIYYAFLVKCPVFIHLFQKPKLTPMLVRELDK